MKTFETQVDELRNKIKSAIQKKIEKSKSKSKFNDEPCIKLNSYISYDCGLTFVEVTKDKFMDENGLEYNFYVPSLDDLAMIADKICKK